MKTEIVNTTTNLVVIWEGIEFRKGIFRIGTREVASIPPKTTFILQQYPRWTHRNLICFESKPGKPLQQLVVEEADTLQLDVEEADEIRIFTLPGCSVLRLRISKRSKSSGNYKDDDSADVNALKEDAFSRMKLIDASRTRLGKLKNRAKICTAQCKNLVQTCLEGTEHMKATYDTVIENDDYVWDLYCSKKLRYLIRSLDKLLFVLYCIEDLMWTCESRWSRMGLYVSSIPFPTSEKKTITKFDILLKELSWNLDTIHYILTLSECAKLEWNEDKCRYVLQSNSGARDVASTEIEPIGTNSLFSEDRARLLFQTKNHYASSKEKFVLVRTMLFFLAYGIFILFTQYLFSLYTQFELITEIKVLFHTKRTEIFILWAASQLVLLYVAETYYPRYFGNEHYYATKVIKGRLQDYSKASQSNIDAGAVPHCFQLDPLHLVITEPLSPGTLRAVYRGKWRGEDVAIIVTRIREHGRMRESIRQDCLKEAGLILKVQHPNVVEFIGYAFTDDAPPPLSSTMKDAEPVSASYLVMELMQRDLQREIRRITRKKPGRPFPDDVTVDILLQIVEAMSHMHECGVIHRDLKAKNCLVSPRFPSTRSTDVYQFYTVKLADFDISKVLDPDASITDHTLRQGTTRWMAPEVWGIGVYVPGAASQKSAYDKSIDVYSFGMTCYEVISGEVPYHECRKNSELEAALQNKERPVLPPGVTCPGRLVDLMSRCWSQKPGERPDFNEIRKVLWTVKYEVEFQ